MEKKRAPYSKRATHFVDHDMIEENVNELYKKRLKNAVFEGAITAEAIKAKRERMKTFAKLLDLELENKSIDQQDMAVHTGIGEASISAYRNGKSEPGFTNVIAMADYLGVDCSYLMTGISAENYHINSDLGLSDKAIKALEFINSSQDNISSRTAYDLKKVTKTINLLLEDVYKDISFTPFGPDDIDGQNVFTAIHDYIYGSDKVSGKIVLEDGGTHQEWSAKYLWPEKCMADIRRRLDGIKNALGGKNNG